MEMFHVMFPDCWKEEYGMEVAIVHIHVPTHLQVAAGTSKFWLLTLL